MERYKCKESNRTGTRMARTLRVSERDESEVGASGSEAQRIGPRTRARVAEERIDIAASNANVEQPLAREPPVSVRCEHCGQEFRNERGLGIHKQSAHPVEANSEINVERVKARWPVEEVRIMARAEATATSAGGIVFMNQHLHEKFPHRTLEAIKGKRRQEAYKEMVRAFCQEIASSFEVANDVDAGDGSAMSVEATESQLVSDPNTASEPSISRHDDEKIRN